jgi:release factor glutamine methyltransferase
VSVVSLEDFLKNFFKEERKNLNLNYPGLTIHRLKQDIKLHSFLSGVDSENLFDFPYIPSRSNPITVFFESLKEGIPLEYITGYAYFYKSLFKVTTDVLIPRSETEILVELAEEEIKKKYKNKSCRILDLGTGSGAIALSLLTIDSVQLDITASDISLKALQVAKENLFNLQFSFSRKHKIKFIQSDRFEKIAERFDIILSNPPYIKEKADLEGVHVQVLKHEPALALFLKDDEYDQWFRTFFESIFQNLSDDGVSLIEGHEEHLDQLSEIAKRAGFKEVQVILDYTQRKRFLKLKK